MQRGLLPGVLALSAKLVPTVQRVARNTVQSLQRFVQEAQDGYAHKKVRGCAHQACMTCVLLQAESSDGPSSSAHSNGSIEMTAPGLRQRATSSTSNSHTT